MNNGSKAHLRDKLKESTRGAIMDAAIALLIDDEAEVRMETIAERAGVAIGTLYNYFANRQDLIDTIIEKRRLIAESYIRQALDRTAELPVQERLAALFQTLVNFLARHRTVTHHSLQLKESSPGNNGRKSLLNILDDHILEVLRAALQRQELRPEYQDIYPIVISGYLRAIFAGAAQEQQVQSGFAAQLAELFLAGAGKKAGKASPNVP